MVQLQAVPHSTTAKAKSSFNPKMVQLQVEVGWSMFSGLLGFNPKMVQLQEPIATSNNYIIHVSIPKWYNYKGSMSIMADNWMSSFNPKMVQLQVHDDRLLENLQSCFNPKMVQLQEFLLCACCVDSY